LYNLQKLYIAIKEKSAFLIFIEMGGYKVQGRSEDDAQRILEDAKALEGWGVKTIVLECIPAKLGKKISQSLNISTIGIGAGAYH
jgi:3-methyl-2-oxobutanoate hydroxymethyltransferase